MYTIHSKHEITRKFDGQQCEDPRILSTLLVLEIGEYCVGNNLGGSWEIRSPRFGLIAELVESEPEPGALARVWRWLKGLVR